MIKLYFPSKRLNLVESLMAEYFNYDPAMLLDEKRICLRDNDISDTTYNEAENKCIIDFETPFKEHEELFFRVSVPYKEKLHEYFSNYFQLQDTIEEEVITEDDKVLLCLEYMSYIYYKEKENLFYYSCVEIDLNISYEYILHKKIYPEILSLYKLILETKQNEKKGRHSEVSIIFRGISKDVNVNTFGWFLNDMEQYFADRFPDLTLDKINQILSKYDGKAGRPLDDQIISNIIWGVYKLLRNHHSKFKHAKDDINKELCCFIIDYLHYIGVDKENTLNYDEYKKIGDRLKRMKNNFKPKWILPWQRTSSEIEEKQPEKLEDRVLQRYPIHYMDALDYMLKNK